MIFDRLEKTLAARPRLPPLLLAAVTLAIFAPVAGAGFFYVDDDLQILGNPYVRKAELWPQIFTGRAGAFAAPGVEVGFYRPLQFAAYWMVYRLAGPNAAAYHLVSLAFYLGCALLVYRLALRLLGTHTAAAGSALLWAVHPLHVEPVAWCSALPDLGAGFFGLWSFHFFLRAEETPGGWRPYGKAALSLGAALLFKEAALPFVVLPLVYWAFCPQAGPEGKWRSRVARWSPLAAVGAAYLLLRWAVLGRILPGGGPAAPGWMELKAALGLMGEHARLFLWPHPLGMFREVNPLDTLATPWPWLALGVLLAAAARAVNVRHATGQGAAGRRVWAFGVLWWGVTLSVVLDVRHLSFPLVADRFALIPSVGLCLALAAVLQPRPAGKQGGAAPDPRVHAYRAAGVAAATLIVALWAGASMRALPAWQAGDYAGWVEAELGKFPDSAVLNKYRAELWASEKRDPDEVRRQLLRARELNRRSFRPVPAFDYDLRISLARLALRQGDEQGGLAELRAAGEAMPRQPMAWLLLGTHYFVRQDYESACPYLERAARLRPLEPGARFYLGSCWMQQGRYREAAGEFRAAYEADRSLAAALRAEAQAWEAAGDAAAATRVRAEYGRAR